MLAPLLLFYSPSMPTGRQFVAELQPSRVALQDSACVDVQVKTTTKSYGNENSWDIDGTITNDHAFAANQQYTQTVCLSPGVHTLHMKDS